MTQIAQCAVRGLRSTYLGCDVQTLTARQQEQQWRQQVAALQVTLENQREDLQDITSNMQRQYKVLGQDPILAFVIEICYRASSKKVQTQLCCMCKLALVLGGQCA